jgi:hypothetical protein
MTKLHKILIAGYLIVNILCLLLQSRTGTDYDYTLNQNVYYIEFYYVKLYSMIMYISSSIFLLHCMLLLAGKTLKKQTDFENHILKN